MAENRFPDVDSDSSYDSEVGEKRKTGGTHRSMTWSAIFGRNNDIMKEKRSACIHCNASVAHHGKLAIVKAHAKVYFEYLSVISFRTCIYIDFLDLQTLAEGSC